MLLAIDLALIIEKLVLISAPASMENLPKDFISMIKAPKSVASRFEKILEKKINMPLAHANLSRVFDKINVGETLIVHDRHDEVVPYSEATAVLENWKEAKLLVTENLGHFQLLKNPDLIEKVSGFVSKNDLVFNTAP